jgi:hypothetical protein
MLARSPFSKYLSTISRPSSPSIIIPEEPKFFLHFPMIEIFADQAGMDFNRAEGAPRVSRCLAPRLLLDVVLQHHHPHSQGFP